MQNIFYFQYMCYPYCMKKAYKHWKVWLFTGILSFVGIATPFIVLIISLNIPDAAPFQYPLLLVAFSAIYVLIGYIWGDLHVVSYRRKNKNWDDVLPDEIKETAWIRRLPFWLAAATIFTVFISFEIIFWITGSYPLL